MEKTKKNNEKKTERRLITAALPYINNIPHLGHIVGSHLPADIFARYSRSKGYETLFIGGSDENGSPCELAAEKIGVPIKEFLDKLHEEHKKIYDWFEISYDNFSRTSRPVHHKTTQEVFKKIYDNKYISTGKIKVFYSSKENRFLPDRYVVGTCPKCGYTEANGDQCEKCTTMLNPTELINPKSTMTGSEVEIREVEHLFLDLKKLSPKLKTWISKQKHWRTQVSSLALGWINEGLKPRCITRDLKHGVPVPLKGFEDKVFYVWFDAPIGYVSSTKEVSKDWEKYWKDKNTKTYQFLGKDNIPFHTIFWPGIILAYGDFILPYQVVGLQYLNYEGGKISKSKKRGVFCERLPDLGVNPDVWRAYLTQLIPETSDSEFKWKEFQERINSDVIGNLGNFYNRTFTFIKNNLNGEIRKPSEKELDKNDKILLNSIKEQSKKITQALEKCEIRKAFSELLMLSSSGNKYFNETEPWVLVKTNPERASKRLYLCASLARALCILSSPFIPNISESAWHQLNLPNSPSEKGIWDSADSLIIPDKHKIGTPQRLFNIIKDEDIQKYKEIVANPTELEELFK
ncbi:MAG: methionine--tRNA ligase [Nanobdellota archaeon]